MEQTAAARSNNEGARPNNEGGNYPIYGNNQLFQQTDAADSQQCMPMFQGSLSLGASQYQPLSHFHTSASPFCQPFEGDGCSRHTSNQIRDMHHPYPLYGSNASGLVHPDNNHDPLQIPRFQGAHSCTSPESLLDLILVAQQKLQQLQAIVELMVRVGGQAQEQQSLAAGVKAIMSQLFSATACLRQQPLDQISGFSQSIEGFDLRFDGLYGNEMNICVPATHHESMNSGIKLVGMKGVETRTSSLLSGSELHTQAMDPVSMKSTEIGGGPSSEVDSRFKEQGPDALFGDPSVINAHRNAGTKIVEMDISKGSLHIACNSNQEVEEHDFTHVSRDDDDEGEGENLPPGSYDLVEMAAAEILAEHTHFCDMCGKGFKRDANLRMHMRGHGDEYKTPAALAKPDKFSASLSIVKPRRYSCPFLGCKRNKQHRKFQPLKTTLCVKNHYRRSHCPKLLTCSKCKVKKFSVVADLKTHEKHCGQDKWQCSCGTTFSRKDKLTGHVTLFAGHTPVVSSHELESLNGGHSEPFTGSHTIESVEGLECLGGSKATLPAPSAGGLAVNSVFEGSNNNGTRTAGLTVVGDEIFMDDEICQQRAVLSDEKEFLLDDSQRGGIELLQHCG